MEICLNSLTKNWKNSKNSYFQNKNAFFCFRGCFSQMFVLQKRFIFARGLNWDQSCLWKTSPSPFLPFSPHCVDFLFVFFSSPDSWGVKKAPWKNLDVFGENWQRNQFPKLTTFVLLFSSMLQLPHRVVVLRWFIRL